MGTRIIFFVLMVQSQTLSHEERQKRALELLQEATELDGGIPALKDGLASLFIRNTVVSQQVEEQAPKQVLNRVECLYRLLDDLSQVMPH